MCKNTLRKYAHTYAKNRLTCIIAAFRRRPVRQVLYTYIHCSQKVGGIWTLKIVALTKTMTHLKQPVLIRQIYLKTICVKVWKFHPGTWLPDHNVRTRGRLQIFTWIRWWQNISRCRNLHRYIRHFHFLSWKFCFAHCVFKLRNARQKCVSFSVNRRICLNFALCASPRDSARLICEKTSGAYRVYKHIFSIAYMIFFFFFFVEFWFRPP